MQTLRKKTSPLKYKNETTRFLGDGVSFKAKLIGILEVSEARGDRMCQEALSDLKMAIRAAGEHKQRITINIAIDGLRLRDEKTGDSLYHHPVHKISFIAQDMTDSRAFGYIFGSPDTGHRFFGIKTDKAASQVVIAMRDLFQVVFALKKKEIELAKQHLDKGRFTSSPLFSDTSVSSTKTVSQEATKAITSESKSGGNLEIKSGGTAVADLVDLELELNSLQQGLNQMERITPSDPFVSKDDPFGDSFISYTKPILPPPPSSGKDRSSRISETNNVFSPKTPHTVSNLDSSCGDSSFIVSRDTKSKEELSFSQDFSNSHDEAGNEDWFTPSATVSGIFEEPPLVPEPTKDEKHEMTKQEILSQFDVFTELDPLGTGRSKPYIDKKHFFQELKNPPKKVLNDLVLQTQQQEPNLFTKSFTQNLTKTQDFAIDPFGEDPFVTEDPFAEADFSKQDPFETEFGDFNSKPQKLNKFDSFKSDSKSQSENWQLYQSNVSKSPKNSVFEKQMSVISTSPRHIQFNKQNTFDAHFDKFDTNKDTKLLQLHENPSLDMSSEAECAPEPPPRPATALMQIKPPPLPPKKQASDLSVKPPPRPPHSEELHYDYIDEYETAPNSLEFVKNIERSPPLPVPARKSKFESDFTVVSERPKKQLSVHSSEEEYLTPISISDEKNELKNATRSITPVLLPPPQKSFKKQNMAQVTVASYLELKPHLTTSTATDNLNCSLEGLDITLSQLTLSGLNELAAKLNIPTNQLSNMTLVQLTNYLSNFIKSKASSEIPSNNFCSGTNSNNEIPAFKADFAANFKNLNSNTTGKIESYDRYAVFRELMNEEIKQTKIDTEPEELKEEKTKLSNSVGSNINNIYSTTIVESGSASDKYAALREIVESELKINETEQKDDNRNLNEQNSLQVQNILNKETSEEIEETHVNNIENKLSVDEKEKPISSKYDFIEYNTPLENQDVISATPIKSPKSPVNKMMKSPVPVAITEIMQNNARLTSGSLSDVVSGSSPEVDNTASNSEIGKKAGDATGESWAIFDQSNIPSELTKEKQPIQSEEGVSPWSSDSKEFGNGSPPEWRHGDSESGGDRWHRRRSRRDQEGWWDTSAEPEMQYYPSNRRSTDSYEEEYYECYERPRRRKQTSYVHGSQAGGGHSSSSRDVSPWEEEPKRRETREQRTGWMKHSRQHSFEKYRDRIHTDSWDDEDDYEYEEEHTAKFHRSDRHNREMERDRYNISSRDHDTDRWSDDWNDERRYRRRREGERDRWCCPDWDQNEHEKPLNRYGRWPNLDTPSVMRRDRKHDERYYSRDSQESPWEDDYSNEADEVLPSHYLSGKRNWKRPSSASEMDRKTGEIKSRYYLGTGGSDGERDRRYKPGRRSRSRDSQYSEPSQRHKTEMTSTARVTHRNKPYSKAQFDNDFTDISPKKQVDNSKFDHNNKKSATLANRKKTKDNPSVEENIVSTFPRKSSTRAKSLFENDFVSSEDSSLHVRIGTKFNFENDFETSEAESPPIFNKLLASKQQSIFEKSLSGSEFSYRQKSLKEVKLSPCSQNKTKSLFEDDFSPSEKTEPLPEDNSISSIKEEVDPNEEDDSFSTNNFENATNSRKKKIAKYRFSNNLQSDVNIKKSESVNIFARESDPFDDDFFSEKVAGGQILEHPTCSSPKTSDLKWTDDFEDFDVEEKK